jgi:hypothetical protein
MSQNPDQRRISHLKTGNSSLGNALADGSGTTGTTGSPGTACGLLEWLTQDWQHFQQLEEL